MLLFPLIVGANRNQELLPKLPELPVMQVESPVPESLPSDLPSPDLPPSDVQPPDVSPPEIELTTSNIERGLKEMLQCKYIQGNFYSF